MSTPTLLPPARGAARGERAARSTPPLPEFLAGDIINFAGQGDPYSWVSRWLMRTAGETPTYAVHTAQFLDADRYLEMDFVVKIRPTGEILQQHLAHDMWQRRGFEVWRCRTLTAAQRDAVTQQALSYLGRKFGMAKFLTHLLDGVLNKMLGREVFCFRRLNHDTRYPICSWITAYSYDRALHYRFGVEPECADPDQIDDWVRAHPDEWACVFRLADYA